MIYNNLLPFIVAIFAISAAPSETPPLAPRHGLPLLALLPIMFLFIADRFYNRKRTISPAAYFATERALSFIALFFFILAVYLIGIKYYLRPLSLNNHFPVLENIGGFCLFFLFLAIGWVKAKKFYQKIFTRDQSTPKFVLTNIKINLPLILPWLMISFLFDLLMATPWPSLHIFLDSTRGEITVLVCFLVLLVILFPPLIKRLWDCRPLPPGEPRAEIETFCRARGFSSRILLWPLYEGMVPNAGVIGFIPKFRYLLITPSLLAITNREEMQAVLAHELGHVKHKHLLTGVALFLCFSILITNAVEPLQRISLSSELLYKLVLGSDIGPETWVAVFTGIPLLVAPLLYIRFIFAYFLRNFERQADLYAFKTMGAPPLISAFKKLALLSGTRHDKKSWHHFGIGERIAFLKRCAEDRLAASTHERKLRLSLSFYFLGFLLIVLISQQSNTHSHGREEPLSDFQASTISSFKELAFNGQFLWALGDLMLERKEEEKALLAYEKALRHTPDNPFIANNIARLLVTARSEKLRDPARALVLARAAATKVPQGLVLDTLALAYAEKGLYNKAIEIEQEAIRIDPQHKKYYQSQLDDFHQRIQSIKQTTPGK